MTSDNPNKFPILEFIDLLTQFRNNSLKLFKCFGSQVTMYFVVVTLFAFPKLLSFISSSFDEARP